MIKGVHAVTPGYTGGTVANPTYEQVSAGTTGHVEVSKIDYDPEQVSFEELLHIFFTSHDPTSVNQQGSDAGPQYASVVFYTTPRQKEKTEHYIEVLNKGAGAKPIVTRVEPLGEFYKAEDYHQKYYENHKDAGYCQLVIAPKVEKIGKKFGHLLK